MQNQALHSAFLTIVPFHPEHCRYLLWLEIIIVLGRAPGGPARAVRLEQMTYRSPFQPQLLCVSVILWQSEYFRSFTVLHAHLLISQNLFFPLNWLLLSDVLRLCFVCYFFFCLCGRREIKTTTSLQLAPFWIVNLPFQLFVFNKRIKTFLNIGTLEKPDCTNKNMTLVFIQRAFSLLLVSAGWYHPAHGPSAFFSISQRWRFDIPTQPVSRHHIFLHVLLSFMLWLALFNILNRRKHFSTVPGRQHFSTVSGKKQQPYGSRNCFLLSEGRK